MRDFGIPSPWSMTHYDGPTGWAALNLTVQPEKPKAAVLRGDTGQRLLCWYVVFPAILLSPAEWGNPNEAMNVQPHMAAVISGALLPEEKPRH